MKEHPATATSGVLSSEPV